MATAKKKPAGESYGPFEVYTEVLIESGGIYGIEAGDVLTVEDGVVSRASDPEVTVDDNADESDE